MTSKQLSAIPFSVLDLAAIAQGQTPADTFKHSLALAQQAEQLGYKRYWFAEHHNMMSVASSAPAVLIGYIAGGTQSIRVGSGGIMLPNHAPLIVAEQFGTLASLYPGRIDLGLGRAPGTDQLTALAIRGENMNASHQFPQDVERLQNFFSVDNRNSKVRANPGEGLDIPIWILGSSTDSARLAAAKGLPYAFASHFAPTYFMEAIKLYRENFRPSVHLDKPYVMACINVVAADTDEQAEYLSTSLKQFFMGVITGKRQLLQPPVANMEEIWNIYEREAVEQMLGYLFVGGPETLKQQMQLFVDQTQVDEVMATSHIFDHDAKMRSYKIFAEMLKSA
ncbi:LLM class flavin-dependent oxidoreductase [Mucilaginibacter paludis]|uniref:Luciferase-like monooxygenase n=1 Tax=Mucilaginibacter paludis DSM 18603 TaxID=714943 RepID=H1Y9M3_9SPHI|nr:LLM class flavin-dependent oxidoreductase [Mucilaginibacter paludis]EHQ30525.1 luciferase family oxidoreductase, group 1 [Mucilaginibacter paludis DSM 18603]